MTGFDPETDATVTVKQAMIAKMYSRLKEQGDDEASEELRQPESVSKQYQLAKNHPEFDPEYDRPNSSDKVAVKMVYDALCEAGRDGGGEDLRAMDTLNSQVEKAIQLDESLFDGEHLNRR